MHLSVSFSYLEKNVVCFNCLIDIKNGKAEGFSINGQVQKPYKRHGQRRNNRQGNIWFIAPVSQFHTSTKGFGLSM